jgi:hypothetical protein
VRYDPAVRAFELANVCVFVMESVHLHSVSEHFQLKLVPPQKNRGPVALLNTTRDLGTALAS